MPAFSNLTTSATRARAAVALDDALGVDMGAALPLADVLDAVSAAISRTAGLTDDEARHILAGLFSVPRREDDGGGPDGDPDGLFAAVQALTPGRPAGRWRSSWAPSRARSGTRSPVSRLTAVPCDRPGRGAGAVRGRGVRVGVSIADRRVRVRAADRRDLVGVIVELSPDGARRLGELLTGAAVAAQYRTGR